jgi:hypothetical protein
MKTQITKLKHFGLDHHLVPLTKKNFALLVGPSRRGLTVHVVQTLKGMLPRGAFEPISYSVEEIVNCRIRIEDANYASVIWIGSTAFDVQAAIGLDAAALFGIKVDDDRTPKVVP